MGLIIKFQTDYMANVEEHIFLARVAEQAERFEDMVDQLEHVLAEKGADVTSDERNLLSVAFKNLISSKRAACRTIAAIEQNPKYTKFADALASYKQGIETKLQDDCQRIIDMINNKVLAKPCDGEPKAFFIKMVGDYYRYIAENAKGDNLDKVKQQALAAYNEANSINLPPCNPIKMPSTKLTSSRKTTSVMPSPSLSSSRRTSPSGEKRRTTITPSTTSEHPKSCELPRTCEHLVY